MTAGARIPLAVCASLALHGGALAVIDRMPQGWQLAEATPARFGAGVLQARVRAAGSGELVAVPSSPSPRAPRAAYGAVAPPAYLPASELDEKPLIRTPVHPEFPAFAPVSEGRVVLRLFIGETGDVDEIAVVSAAPAEVFEHAAMQAFRRASFTPGRKNGAPVKSALTLELLFGAPLPVAQAKAAEGPLFQAPRRNRLNPPSRKETP